MRRTKHELESMTIMVQMYLLVSGNDQHKAYDDCVRAHLLAGKPIPSFIRGLKDFVNVSNLT